jgi:hypothetical protein
VSRWLPGAVLVLMICRAVTGCRQLVTGNWSLALALATGTGHWQLVTGHWSLVAGCEPDARDQKQEARNQKPETRNKKIRKVTSLDGWNVKNNACEKYDRTA